MKKYILRYLIFWAPAVLIACFFNNGDSLSQILQWFFAFFMLFGWVLNTGMSACRFPHKTLSVMLLYLGVNLLLIVALYNLNTGSEGSFLILRLFGLFSFTPLDIVVDVLLDYNIPQEIYVTAGIFICCLLGWLLGVIYRRFNPDPYRPRIIK